MAGNQPVHQEKNTKEVGDKGNAVEIEEEKTGEVVVGGVSLGQEAREDVEEAREGVAERSTTHKSKETAKSINNGVLRAAIILHGKNIVVHRRRAIRRIRSLGLRGSHSLLRKGDLNLLLEVELGGFLVLDGHGGLLLLVAQFQLVCVLSVFVLGGVQNRVYLKWTHIFVVRR